VLSLFVASEKAEEKNTKSMAYTTSMCSNSSRDDVPPETLQVVFAKSDGKHQRRDKENPWLGLRQQHYHIKWFFVLCGISLLYLTFSPASFLAGIPIYSSQFSGREQVVQSVSSKNSSLLLVHDNDDIVVLGSFDLSPPAK
jgi:hypothetical protein